MDLRAVAWLNEHVTPRAHVLGALLVGFAVAVWFSRHWGIVLSFAAARAGIVTPGAQDVLMASMALVIYALGVGAGAVVVLYRASR